MNWSTELPEMTGKAEEDLVELYNWAEIANQELKRMFKNLSEVNTNDNS